MAKLVDGSDTSICPELDYSIIVSNGNDGLIRIMVTGDLAGSPIDHFFDLSDKEAGLLGARLTQLAMIEMDKRCCPHIEVNDEAT